MFKKLKILTLLQPSEKIKVRKDTTISQKLGIVGKTILAMAFVYGILTGLCALVFNVLFFTPSVNLFVFFIFVMQVISIISCTVSLSDSLYISRDNQLLLTYPVKHIYIYVSKLIVAYIIEFIKSLKFTFPLFMAYMTIVPGVLSFNYLISSIIFSIILPLFPVLFGAILSIPVVYANKLIAKSVIAKGVLTLIGIGLLIGGTRWIVSILPDSLRIVALYNSFIKSFNQVLGNINNFSLYAQFIGQSMYGKNIFLNDLFTLLCLLVLGGVSILLSLPLFYKLASSVTENSVQKVHKAKNVTHKSTFMTFMRKELTLSIRNIGDFASNYLFLFILPFVLIIISSIYVRIDRNDIGVCMTYGFIGLITLIMLSASNTASATAISSEGNEFVLLKTAPGKTSNIVWSKLLINFIITFIALTITFIALSFTLKGLIDIGRLWIVYIFVLLIDIGLILWSIQFDILNPKLREYANSQNRGEVKNFSKSIMIGTVVSLIFSIILILVFMLSFPTGALFTILLIIGLIFAGLRFYFLVNYMNAYFEDIQL